MGNWATSSNDGAPMNSDSVVPLATIVNTGHDVIANKMVFTGVGFLAVYDWIIMLPDEVKYIWRENFTSVTVIYLFIRYFCTSAILVGLSANIIPSFTTEMCKRFASFEPLGTTLPILASANTLMLLRVYAIYRQNKFILAYLLSLLSAEVATGIWTFTKAGHTIVSFPFQTGSADAFHICESIPDPKLGIRSAIFLFLEVAFNSSVFMLTSYKTIKLVFSKEAGLMKTLAQHGLIYYGAIATSSLLWALMVIFASPGLQYINAAPTDSLSVILVCRITISLRRIARGRIRTDFFSIDELGFITERMPVFKRRTDIQDSSIMTTGARTGLRRAEAVEMVVYD